MNNYKISIIIPCYNVEKYIDRCLNSVANQTIGPEHLEIILVNDASTDNTLEILKKWEQEYSDNIILVTYDKNLRQGGARNIGLGYATGDFIGFVDSDDWIELDMYSLLADKMLTGKYDAVRCQLIRDKANKEPSEFSPEWGGIVTGLYRRELIFSHDVSFPEGVSYEDNYWGPLIARYIGSECRIERPLYHYYINLKSTVTQRNQLSQLDRMKIETMLVDEYIRRGFFKNDYEQIFEDFLDRYYLNTWFIVFTRFDDIPDLLTEMTETFAHYFPDYRKLLSGRNFTYRSQLLIDMLLEPENTDIYVVKLKWLRSWLKDQGIEL